MDRKTRDKFASGTNRQDLTTGNACWQTPPAVFQAIQRRAGRFDLDLTADAANHLCLEWFGPDSPAREFDALTAEWYQYGTSGYSNPPYGPFLQRILMRAVEQAKQRGFRSTFLLPLRMTKVFRYCLFKSHAVERWLIPDKRITFFENNVPRLNEKNWREHGRAVADPALFDSTILIIGPSAEQVRIEEFEVPEHVTKLDLERAAEARCAREDRERASAGLPAEAATAPSLADA